MNRMLIVTTVLLVTSLSSASWAASNRRVHFRGRTLSCQQLDQIGEDHVAAASFTRLRVQALRMQRNVNELQSLIASNERYSRINARLRTSVHVVNTAYNTFTSVRAYIDGKALLRTLTDHFKNSWNDRVALVLHRFADSNEAHYLRNKRELERTLERASRYAADRYQASKDVMRLLIDAKRSYSRQCR
jgi:hypothetical protein